MAKVAKKAAQSAQLAGTGLGTVIITAGVIQIIDNIPFGNGADLAFGNMGQVNFFRRCIWLRKVPNHHHIAEETAQVQIVTVNGARRTQLDNIQIMQIIHNKIRNIRIRRMPVWVRHINVCTHYCE